MTELVGIISEILCNSNLTVEQRVTYSNKILQLEKLEVELNKKIKEFEDEPHPRYNEGGIESFANRKVLLTLRYIKEQSKA